MKVKLLSKGLVVAVVLGLGLTANNSSALAQATPAPSATATPTPFSAASLAGTCAMELNILKPDGTSGGALVGTLTFDGTSNVSAVFALNNGSGTGATGTSAVAGFTQTSGTYVAASNDIGVLSINQSGGAAPLIISFSYAPNAKVLQLSPANANLLATGNCTY